MTFDTDGSRDMHRGWNGIVRRLAHIDMVVRMDRRLRADLAAEPATGEVRDHLVYIHVCLGAGACLPYKQGEMGIELAVGYLPGDAGNGRGPPAVERTKVAICLCRGAFDQSERAHNFDRHPFGPDPEIVQRSLRLRAPQFIGSDLQRPKSVAFDPRFRMRFARFTHCGVLAASWHHNTYGACCAWQACLPDLRWPTSCGNGRAGQLLRRRHCFSACRACRV